LAAGCEVDLIKREESFDLDHSPFFPVKTRKKKRQLKALRAE
jgi:hypothetical protein